MTDIGSLYSQGGTPEQFSAAKAEASRRFLRPAGTTPARALSALAHPRPNLNVVGVGLGEKLTAGRATGLLAIKFFVQRKYTRAEMRPEDLLPETMDGLPTDVDEVGLFRALPAGRHRKAAPGPSATPGTDAAPDPRVRIRPAPPGSSIGFQFPGGGEVMAGTFGALVQDGAGVYVLSNNHVLANENGLPPGSPIFQPGLLDGGQIGTDQIAALDRFVTLTGDTPNVADCAVAKVADPSLVTNAVLQIGPPTGAGAAQIDMTVQKFGRTTGYSAGRITSVDTDVTVNYDAGNYTFTGQMIVVGLNGEDFSGAGDSGSLILDRTTRAAVGLLFAGSPSHTIANPVDKVLSLLGVTLVTETA